MSEAIASFGLDGVFKVEHRRDGKIIHTQICENQVIDEGLTHALDLIFNSGAQITAWYLGVYETNYAPQADDTASNISGRAIESTAYDETNRVTFNSAAATGLAVTNSANRAVFTINATKTMYGCFVVSNSGKNSQLGTLMSVVLFDNAREVKAGDELLVTYTMNAQDV